VERDRPETQTCRTPAPAPARRGRLAALAGLWALYVSLHLNRQILGILAQPIKSDLGLSDTAIGALTGSSFAVVYALIGLHFGRMADVRDRMALVRIGALVWSLAALAGGLASSLFALVAARTGVAVGEAIATAAAVSLMAELAGPLRRSVAAGVFFSGAFVGAGLAAAAGGAIVQIATPWLGAGSWRAALIAAALPGLVTAAALHGHGDPDPARARAACRRDANRTSAVLFAAAGLDLFLQWLWPARFAVPAAIAVTIAAGRLWLRALRRGDPAAYRATLGAPDFRRLLLALSAVLFVDFAAAAWLIPYAQRRYAHDDAQLGNALGFLLIGGGIAGAVIAGAVSDRWRGRWSGARVAVALLAFLVQLSAILTALHQPALGGFLAAWTLISAASGAWTGVAASIALDLVPPAHHSTGTAVYFLVTTVLGPGLGPFAVGLLSDTTGSIDVALTVCCAIGLLGAAGFVALLRSPRAAAPRPDSAAAATGQGAARRHRRNSRA